MLYLYKIDAYSPTLDPQTVLAWLDENCEWSKLDKWGSWAPYRLQSYGSLPINGKRMNYIRVEFRRKADAVEFKLRWGGQ